MTGARVIQVIEATCVRGDGHKTITRQVKQYFDFDGNLLAENDPCAGADKVEDYEERRRVLPEGWPVPRATRVDL
jgi:hypothetical protein